MDEPLLENEPLPAVSTNKVDTQIPPHVADTLLEITASENTTGEDAAVEDAAVEDDDKLADIDNRSTAPAVANSDPTAIKGRRREAADAELANTHDINEQADADKPPTSTVPTPTSAPGDQHQILPRATNQPPASGESRSATSASRPSRRPLSHHRAPGRRRAEGQRDQP